jgi:hypothetical protein
VTSSIDPEKPVRKPLPRWAIPAVTVIVLALIGIGFFGVNALASDNRQAYQVAQERHQTILQMSKDIDALRKQVQTTGETPVAPPAAEIIAGSTGEAGKNGLDGTNGQDGNGVQSMDCQSDGSWLITYSKAAPQTVAGPCVGQQGPAGANGANGADSTVAGPAGAPGADGQPAVSWTFPYTDELGTTVTYTCVRDDPFDPAAPTYHCTTN